MPVGKESKFGPVTVGPYYPENLPFGIGQAYDWMANDPKAQSALSGMTHPWPWYYAGTDQRTPFGDAWGQAGEALGAVPQAAWEGGKQLGSFFGVGGPPAPRAPKETPKAAPQAQAQTSAGSNPFEALIKGLSGPSSIKAGKVPAGADYSKARAALNASAPNDISGPDYSAARSYMQQSAPGTDNQISDDDKLMFILQGLSKAGLGVADSGDLGDILFALGMGALGGWGDFKAAKKGDARTHEEQMREYAKQMAAFEGGAAENDFTARNSNEDRRQRYQAGVADFEAGVADRKAQDAWKTFELTAPKFSGGNMITGDVGKDGNLSYSATPMGDPDLARKLQFMALAGGPNINVAQSILAGEDVPGLDPSQVAQMRTALLQQYQTLLADENVQDALMNMSGNGQIDVKSADAQQYIMMLLDNMVQQNDPTVYNGMLGALQQKHMFRGLAGNLKW